MSALKYALGALALVLGACATVMEAPAALPPGSRYVAMGSSFAAGPRLGSPKPGTPERCARDQANYASLLAQRLGLDLVDATCSGATTAHLLSAWNELPAQLDALTPDTRLVTVTIGGNDVNFVRNLYIAGCDPATAKRQCPAFAQPTDADWAKLEANLREFASQVRSRAPNARLVFVDYVTMVPAAKTCAAVPFSQPNAVVMRQAGAKLAEITAKVAREADADLLAAGALSQTHTPCDPEPWSMGAPGSGDGAPWHPNAAGMHAVADALALKLRGD